MEFQIALHLRFGGLREGFDYLDARVSFDASARIRDLVTETLRGLDIDERPEKFCLVLLREMACLSMATPIRDCGLLRGDALLLRESTDAERLQRVRYAEAAGGVWLRDERGRDAGRMTHVGLGEEILVRSAPTEAGLWVDDPSGPVAAAVLRADERGGFRLAPAEGEVRVDGEVVTQPVLVEFGQGIALGHYSLLRVLKDVNNVTPNSFGQIPFVPSVADDVKPASKSWLTAPRALGRKGNGMPFPWETLLSSVLMAAFFVAVFERAVFAWLVLVPVLVGVAAFVRRRRQDRRQRGLDEQELSKRIDRAVTEMTDAAANERATRIQNSPEVRSDIFRRAYRRLGGVWSRPRDMPGFLALRVGTTRFLAECEVRGDLDELPADTQARFAKAREMVDVPALLPLRSVNVGICGCGDELLEFVQELVLQAAVLHAPRDLRIIIAVSDASAAQVRESLRSLSWLPHVQVSGLPVRTTYGRDAVNAQLVQVAGELSRLREAGIGKDHPHTLLVLHESIVPDPALLDKLFESWPDSVHLLWFGANAAAVPPQADAVVRLRDGVLSTDSQHLEWDVALWQAPNVAEEARRRRAGLDECSSIARALAPLYDPRDVVQGESLPDSVSLLPLLAEARKVGSSISAKSLLVALGTSEHGPLVVDLVRDGPHMLIGGTTGSGKSELLQTMVASIIDRYSDDEVMLFLFDFKGGATFAGCESLAQTIGSVTNLTLPEVERALLFLEAELQGRMRLFDQAAKDDAAQIRSYEQYRAAKPNAVLPRILVLFDEFAALVGQFESARATAMRIAQQGRSLGVHVVLATQRPSTATISADVQANVGVRVALRTVSDAESHVVIGTADAALIPATLPGRALLRGGAGPVVGFQAGFAGTTAPTDTDPTLRMSWFGPIGVVRERRDARDDDRRPTSFEVVLKGAPRVDPLEPADRRLHPSFDASRVAVAAIGTAGPAVDDGVIAVGECDDVANQSRFVLEIALAGGAMVIAGGIGSGKSTVLAGIAQQVRAYSHETPTLIAIDSAGDDLGEKFGGAFEWIIHSSDRQAMSLLLSQLEREITRRQSAPLGHRGEPCYLFIDDLQQLYEQYVYRSDDHEVLRVVADLIRRGRRVGMFVVASAPSLHFGNAQLRGVFTHRLQLRPTPDDEEFVPGAVGLHPGVAIDSTGRPVKCFAGDPDERGQEAGRGRSLSGWFGWLPDRIADGELPKPPGVVAVGFAEVERTAIAISAEPGLHVLIAASDMRARAAALSYLVEEYARLGNREILRLSECVSAAVGDESVSFHVEALEAMHAPNSVVAIDDANNLHKTILAKLVNVCADRGRSITLIASLDPSGLVVPDPRPPALRDLARPIAEAQRLLYLGVDGQARQSLGQLFGVSLVHRPDLDAIPGRGVLLERGRQIVIQVPGVI